MPTAAEARSLVEELDQAVHFYKLGLQLFMADGYFGLVEWLTKRNKQVFVDLKFFDVPETVALAVRQLRGKGVTFTTVHGNEPMLAAACAEKDQIKILAVTVLTSLDQSDINALGFKTDVQTLVVSRASRALSVGCDGVIASGEEAQAIRKQIGDQLLVVVPGIRPVENRRIDDQKRIVSVEQAFLNGADYIVVGRPIRDAANRRAAAEDIQKRIARLFTH